MDRNDLELKLDLSLFQLKDLDGHVGERDGRKEEDGVGVESVLWSTNNSLPFLRSDVSNFLKSSSVSPPSEDREALVEALKKAILKEQKVKLFNF